MRVIFPAKTDGKHWVWCRERGWGPQHTSKGSPEAHLCSVHPAPRLPTTSTTGQLCGPQLYKRGN